MIKLNSKVYYRKDIDTTDLDGEVVMMDLDKGQYFALNNVASRIWQLIEEPTVVEDIIQTLLNEYDIDRDSCEKSVLKFLGDLKNVQLLCEV